jgi:ribulose kinase
LRRKRSNDFTGRKIALLFAMRTTNARTCTVLLGAALMGAVSMTPVSLRAEDHKTYHDAKHNDDHQWNNHEDQAYRMWTNENHRKYREFAKLKEEDRQSYWGWRHEHSDAVLKIDIH